MIVTKFTKSVTMRLGSTVVMANLLVAIQACSPSGIATGAKAGDVQDLMREMESFSVPLRTYLTAQESSLFRKHMPDFDKWNLVDVSRCVVAGHMVYDYNFYRPSGDSPGSNCIILFKINGRYFLNGREIK